MKQLLQKLNADIQEKSLLKHPFYQMWNEGTVPKAALKEYAIQYYHFTENFPRYVAAIFRNCKNPAMRRVILKNLVEEELGEYENGKPHAEQWLQFAKALGVTKEEAISSTMDHKTKELLKTLYKATDTDVHEGAAAILAYEMQVSDIAITKKHGLQKHYNIKSKSGLEFFNTHQVADIEHIKVWKKMLNDAPEEKHPAIRAAFNKSLDAQWAFLDGIMEKFPEMCAVM